MKRLQCEITVGKYRFNYVHAVSIDSSWETFTDTAMIQIPNRFRSKDNRKLIVGADSVFNRGDAVEIKLGYFPNLTSRFTGYVAEVKPGWMMTIHCEDEMWKLKQVNLAKKPFESATIKDVVSYCVESLSGLQVEYDDETANIGDFHIDNHGFVNAVSVFEVLKNQFGYNIYFQSGKLYVRVLSAVRALNTSTHKMDMNYNVISNDMTYQRDDDTDMMVKFESKQSDDTVLTFYGYKENGDIVITTTAKQAGVVHSWNVPDRNEEQIKKIITENIDKYIWEGFSGAFTTFLEPYVQHSDKVQLINKKEPDHEGNFILQNVVTEFGLNGGRQTIQPRNRV